MSVYSFLKKLFSLILPVTVLVLIPISIESRLVVQIDSQLFIGILLAAGGLTVLVVTASMLFGIGNGTIAPWNPTRKLVVDGPYQYVRNPMITGVLTVLLGESLIVHSFPIFIWLIVFFVINNVYFVLSEEPGLVKRFGEEYLEYKRNVPKWIPRLTPWKPTDSNAAG